MKTIRFCLSLMIILPSLSLTAQKLKKADRTIVANLQSHVSRLASSGPESRKAGTNGEKLAVDYISKHLSQAGYTPSASVGEWIQSFDIVDGKKVLPATSLTIDEHSLKLFTDYFPFPFSANKKAEGSVAIALRETGYPWFKSLEDIIEDGVTLGEDIHKLIINKSKQAAEKGASALIIFSASQKDLEFDSLHRFTTVDIPVIYLTKEAFLKYCKDESAVVDIKLNIELADKKRTSGNIIGFANNNADSTVIVTTNMGNEKNIAAIMEIGRLLKNQRSKKYNTLLVIHSAEENGSTGAKYFQEHSPVNQETVHYTLNLDSLSQEENDGLSLVNKSVELLNK